MPRVHEIARELDTDSRAVLDRLNGNGFPVPSASSPLTPAAVAFLRGQPYTPPLPGRRGVNPFAVTHDLDHDDDLDVEPITTARAARMARVSPATIRQWAARGYLRPVGGRGRSALWHPDDVEHVAADRRHNAAAQRRPVPRGTVASKDLDQLVTGAQAATIAGVAPATIRTWAARGHLAPVTEPGKRPQLYRVQDVLRAARRR